MTPFFAVWHKRLQQRRLMGLLSLSGLLNELQTPLGSVL